MSTTVAAVQLDANVAHPDDRLEEVEQYLIDGAKRGVKLAVFPEMALIGYAWGDVNAARAEPVPGPVTDSLAALARKYDMVLAAGLTERADGDLYNTMVVVDPDGYRGRYRKMHVASFECASWKSAGRPQVIDTDLGAVGVGICADMAHRTPWRYYRRAGIDFLLIGSAWPTLMDQDRVPMPARLREAHRETARAMPAKFSRALGVPVIFANACGHVHARIPGARVPLDLSLAGMSRIVDGDVCAEAADPPRPEMLVADVAADRRAPDERLWDERWMAHMSAVEQSLLLGGDLFTGYLSRPVYRLARVRQRRSS